MSYASDKKPGELTALTTLATDDVFVVGDTSDASEVAKAITKANLITDLSTSFAPALGADDNYVTDAEKAALHPAVTVTDSSEINFTLTGQDITASLVSSSIDETKLDTSVNASLDLADSAVQENDSPSFGTVTATVEVVSPELRASSSAGILVEANNGTDVGILGVGNTANVEWSGSHNFALSTQDTIAGFTGAGKTLGSLATATYPSLTELSYVKGVTSAIQTQISAKANSSGALTQFVGNGTHKVFYSDGSGDVQEIALGADGTFLKSNGASVAPSFAAPSGGGDVTKVGTPVNNQVGVWTGDGTIEGDTALTFDTTTDNLSVGLSGVITTGSIEVGHASDATITRVSAGLIAVEGSNLIRASDVDDTPVNGETAVPVSSNWAFDHAALASSDTVVGHVELAISSEVNTGTDATRAITPDSLAGSNLGIRYITVTLNGTTALTTSEKAYFRIPAALTGMNLVSVAATVGTGATGSSSSGTPTFTVKNVTDANQMLSTSLTVDASEYTSATAATPAVINGTYDDVVTDDLIEVAVTTAGTGVTYATISLGFQLP